MSTFILRENFNGYKSLIEMRLAVNYSTWLIEVMILVFSLDTFFNRRIDHCQSGYLTRKGWTCGIERLWTLEREKWFFSFKTNNRFRDRTSISRALKHFFRFQIILLIEKWGNTFADLLNQILLRRKWRRTSVDHRWVAQVLFSTFVVY